MKEVFAITQKQRDEELTEFVHVLFGIDKNDLRSATRYTEARKEINWNRDFVWGLLCDEETFEYIANHLDFGGFDPYENPETMEVQLKEMANMHFYKEVQML